MFEIFGHLPYSVKLYDIIKHHLTHCNLETPKRVFGKQCRPRSDAAEHGNLIRVSTVCKQLNHFSFGIPKSHRLTYLKSNLDSSNIQCGGVHSVNNGLIFKMAAPIRATAKMSKTF